jgi:hypothetical protein
MLRRLGCLAFVVPLLVALLAILTVGDFAVRSYATTQISHRIESSVPEASGVHSRIQSFPFTARLLVSGHVPELGTHVDHLAAVAGLSFSDLDVDLRNVSIDRHALLSHHQVRLTGIGHGTVTVSLTQESLTSGLGRAVRIAPGGVVVADGTASVQASVAIAGRQVVVRAVGLPVLTVPLPSVKLLPCAPQLALTNGRATFTCTFTGVPAAFATATVPTS